MTTTVSAISPEHRRIVLDITRSVLPPAATIWAFGSRVTGRSRRYSDLDLVLDAKRRLTLDELGRLAEAFSDSDLPYKVDVVDWHGIDDNFRRIISQQRVKLTQALPPDETAAVDPSGTTA